MAKLIEITGKAISGEWGSDDEAGTGVPILRTTNFTNDGVINFDNVVTRTITKRNISDKYLRCGDIIIEKSGGSDKQPVGRVVYYEGPDNIYLFNNFTGLLRIQDRNIWNSKYVFYALYRNYCQGGTLAFENKTTGLHNLKIDDFVSKVDIGEAPLPIQEQICSVIDRVRLIIATRKQQLNELDNLVKARFVELFGDPEYNSKRWPMQILGKLCIIGSSKRIYQNEQSTFGVPFWRISDLVNKIDTGVADSNLFIPEKKYLELKQKGLVPVAGDILVTSRGTLGKCYVVKREDRFYFQDGMISWLSGYDENIMPLYLQYLFTMSGFRKQIDSMQMGSTVAYLSIAMLKRLRIMVPSKNVQQRFATFVAQVDKSKVAVQAALDEAQTLFDSLMQQYFG